MENLIKENKIEETVDLKNKSRVRFEMSSKQAGNVTDTLSKMDTAIRLDKPVSVEDLDNLAQLAGNIKIDVGGEIMTVEEAEKIPNLKKNAEIWKEMSEGNFDNLRYLTIITPRVSKFLEHSFDIRLRGLISAKGLVLPKSINGSLYLTKITSAEGLVLPTHIGCSLFLSSLASEDGLVLPTSIGRDLELGVTTARLIKFPRTIKKNLWLTKLISAEGLVLPSNIGGGLYLNSLSSAKGLVLPESVDGAINLDSLSEDDKEKLRIEYPQHSGKI